MELQLTKRPVYPLLAIRASRTATTVGSLEVLRFYGEPSDKADTTDFFPILALSGEGIDVTRDSHIKADGKMAWTVSATPSPYVLLIESENGGRLVVEGDLKFSVRPLNPDFSRETLRENLRRVLSETRDLNPEDRLERVMSVIPRHL